MLAPITGTFILIVAYFHSLCFDLVSLFNFELLFYERNTSDEWVHLQGNQLLQFCLPTLRG